MAAVTMPFSVSGCSVDVEDPMLGEDAMLGESHEELWGTWGPSGDAPHLLGVALPAYPPCNDDYCFPPPLKSFAWFFNKTTNDSWTCRGTSAQSLCTDGIFEFTSPYPAKAIVGVGIAHDTSHVYAWYMNTPAFPNGSYSQGKFTDLSRYHGLRAFSPAIKPSTGDLFSMADLIEVDNTDNLSWYYYWKDGNNVYRSKGTSNNAQAVSGPALVAVSPDDGPIVGIAFDDNYNPPRIVTYYSNGRRNVSNNSLDLRQ